MAAIKTVKIDGEDLHIFNSAIYIFHASMGYTLEIELIISEVAAKKYQKADNLIIEVELEGGDPINAIMQAKVLYGRLPQLHLFNEIESPDEYKGILVVNESDTWFPNLEVDITLEEIRKVEMPNEAVNLKLKLPIDQVEWLKKQKKQELNDLFREWIYQLIDTSRDEK